MHERRLPGIIESEEEDFRILLPQAEACKHAVKPVDKV